MFRLFLILSLIFQIDALRRRCIQSGLPFPDEIHRSPIVVYGEPITKRIYVDTDTELLYNITFRVDCILKGQDIENRIEITEAGIKTGHTACHRLDPGQLYVVYLEKWGTNGYHPFDFQERLVDNITKELLVKTCHLTRTLPLHSTTNICPNVSWIGYCPHDSIDVNVMPKQPYSDSAILRTKSSYFNNDRQFYLQSNVTIPQDGFTLAHLNTDSSNSACILSIKSILGTIIILQIITII